MDRANFPDGHDIYVEDLTLLVDTVETELNKRMLHVTLTKGVAEGLVITTQNDQVTIGVGQAYNDVRFRMVVAAPIVVGVTGADVNKWVVLTRTTTDTMPQAHPLTGVVSNRRTIEGVEASIQAAPSAGQVKLCKITAAPGGVPPTISTIGVDRDILSVRVIKPYLVVALDGTGDYTSLEAALAAMATGQKVYVKAGSYDVSTTPTVSVSNVHIEGDGVATKIRVPGDVTRGALLIQGAGIGTEISDIYVGNLQVEYADVYANQASPTTLPALIRLNHCRNVTIENVHFVNSNQKANYVSYGLVAETNAVGVNVTRCRSSVATKRFNDVVLTKGSDTTVEGCDFIGFDRAGIHHDGTGSEKIIITDNTLTGTTGLLSQCGIAVSNGAHITIANNSEAGCSYGVLIPHFNVVGTPSRGTISGNILVSNGKFGVELGSGSSRFVVDGNAITDNGGSGVRNNGTNNVVTADNVS